MPFVDPALGSPFPTVEQIMNLARVRVNDTMNDISGDLLANDTPYAETMLNGAWRWLQARYATSGGEPFIREVNIFGFPVSGSQDVADQASLTWMGSYDGRFQYDSPSLPQDLIIPLSVWRRQAAGDTTGGGFQLMTQATDGLPRYFDYNVYDWRDDGIYFYGTQYAQDLRIRYSAYRAPLLITQPDQLVTMMMCEDCLSARVAFEYGNARGSVQAPTAQQMAEDALQVIIQRTTRRKQRQSIRRIGFNGRRDVGSGWQPGVTATVQTVSSSNFADNETPIATGSAAEFTLAHSPVVGSLQLIAYPPSSPGFGATTLYMGVDYTLSGATITIINGNTYTADQFRAWYRF